MDDRGTLLDDDATGQDVYSTLTNNEIRTLLLAPAKKLAPIECEMGVISSPDKTQYEALSYVWGHSSCVKKIRCNGFDFEVTESLHSALLSLRYRDSWRRLWVDQLCINQIQPQELMSQLSLMGDIYSNAVRVVVWLGNYDHKLAQAWQLLQDSAISSSLVRSDFLQTSSSPSPRRPKGIRRMSSSSTSSTRPSLRSSSSRDSLTSTNSSPSRSTDSGLPVSSLLKNCLAIFQHSWFSRKWTFPEIVLSRAAIICFGNVEMAWSDLTSWYFHYASKLRSSSLVYDSHGSFENIINVRSDLDKGQLKLSNLLMLTRQRKSLKDEDAIYALFGLVPDLAQHLCVSADHLSDLEKSPFDIYLAALKYCISKEQNLSILSAAGIYQGNLESSFPTWLPDWRQQLPLRPLVLVNDQQDLDDYDVPSLNTPIYSFETKGNDLTLKVRGFRIGCILARKNAWPSSYLVSEKSVDKVLRPNKSSPSFSQSIDAFQFNASDLLGLSRYTRSVLKNALKRQQNCESVRTAAMAKTGDLVCVLLGGPVLYIVRPISDTNPELASSKISPEIRCRFIGECAVRDLAPNYLMDLFNEENHMDFCLM